MKNYSIEIKWAIRFTLLTLAWAIGEKFAGLHDKFIADYALYTNLFGFPALLFFILALKEKKKYFFNGTMTWTQGFVSGVILSFVIALFTPITQYVIYKSITPHFFDTIIAYKLKSGFMTAEVAQQYFNLQTYMLQNSFSNLSMGIITGALVSLFIRTKK
ncbi:DUF4199 domain-containing protein [Flavobacterium phycosphaerae]|uniref:DUF4199 domain-containing protein n=1 Tax=Flavobacterium phycosphaerae TaxID=2697515 RepID=UPI00138AF897|nr:DUF4199 domain-containing protein [Flavobacterium phycosphaerae]